MEVHGGMQVTVEKAMAIATRLKSCKKFLQRNKYCTELSSFGHNDRNFQTPLPGAINSSPFSLNEILHSFA